MSKQEKLTRREFMKMLGAAASATALGGCASTLPVDNMPEETDTPALPTPEPIEPTPAPPTPTEKPVTEPAFPEMVRVEPGIFEMGSEDGHAFEKPVHTVELTRPFLMAIYAVTYKEYDIFCADTQPYCTPEVGIENYPVSGKDWFDAVAYCNWLSEKAGLTPCYSSGGKATKCDFTANGYRLPSEAEWEYAARGGQNSQGYIYSGSNNPDEVGWHAGNSGGSAHPVGQKKPNELGIYDMSGNRWEWCWDWFDRGYYALSPQQDPTGPTTVPEGTFVERSRRSSSAVEDAATLRVSYRSADYIDYPGDNGFRLVRTVIS